jgi:hypothetical protein
LFQGAPTELSLAFDQNCRPVIAYVEAGTIKLYWFDTQAAAQTTTAFDGLGTSPMLCLDDKRTEAATSSDVLLAYLRDGYAYYRQQRDRYGIEYTLGRVLGASPRIMGWGMSAANRVQLYAVGA